MARAALGWSTRKLAELADVGLNTVNRFEGGMNSRENNIGASRSKRPALNSTLTAKVYDSGRQSRKASGNDSCAVPSRPRVA
jgi:transcriptional regulator with XRE-family HTH domain